MSLGSPCNRGASHVWEGATRPRDDATTGSPSGDLALEDGRVAVRIDRERDNEDQPPDDWHQCDDATVVAGMRRGWDEAYAEFFDRYTRLLTRLAQRRGLPAGARMELVLEFLDDMALRLGRSVLPVPRDLAGYLATSFRHRMGLHWRHEERRARRLEGMLLDTGAAAERAVAESLSEYAVRSTESVDQHDRDEESDLDRPRQRQRELREALAQALLEAATEEERTMLGYLAEGLPQRDIAHLLGITPGAARVRIHRLRERLRATARAYANVRPVEEGLLLARLLAQARRGHLREVRTTARGTREDTTDDPRQDQRLERHDGEG